MEQTFKPHIRVTHRTYHLAWINYSPNKSEPISQIIAQHGYLPDKEATDMQRAYMYPVYVWAKNNGKFTTLSVMIGDQISEDKRMQYRQQTLNI